MPIDPSLVPPFKYITMSHQEAVNKLSVNRRMLGWDSELNLIQVQKRWHTKNSRPLYEMIRFENGCWMWTASQRTDGYGQLTVARVTLKAHHFMYFLFFGRIPTEHCVLHRCDVPLCVNPDHLILGTQQDNVTDMISKGRHWSKRGYKMKKLTTDSVTEIRASNEKVNVLALRYGCTRNTITRAQNRRTFKDVP